jgi:LacI family transcriptional regulator
MSGMQRIAVLVETSGNFGREILRGVADWARENTAWQLAIEPGDATRTRLLPAWHGDGIIARARGPALAAAVAACDVPRVLLAPPQAPLKRQRHPQVQMPMRSVDDLATCAFEYLRGLGLREFAFCDHPELGGFKRGEHFAAAAKRAGFASRHWRAPQRGDPRRSLTVWLEKLPRPCGLWCANDDLGLQVIELIRSVGMSVPGDVVVLGCDDDAFLCELATPQLASIAVGTYAAGREAARLLAELIAGRKATPRPLEPPRVIARASSEWSGCADPLAARAMARLAAAEPPRNSGDLARGLGVSVRSLERHLKVATGHTPGRLARAQRLAAAQRLLLDTAMTVTDIAARCGYASATRLGEAIKRSTGLTPQAWRKANIGG